jgi:8-oxo-dGTP pyrophosphatase MutT (NUDIX family)
MAHERQGRGPEEARLEEVQIVDRDNRPIKGVPRWLMRRDRLIHRACSILVVNGHGAPFIQKRTPNKDVYPGLWDLAAGGVVLAGEDYLGAAHRELEEELGITVPGLEYLFDQYHEDASNRVWGRIYLAPSDGPFTLQAAEVEHGHFLPFAEIPALHAREPFTPDSMLLLTTLEKHRPDIVFPPRSALY